MPATPRRAAVIGAGPNGLAAAIVLAQAGLQVDVFEAEAQPGGAARTLELTLPGFLHDFGSAVHPMAAGSPFFSSLPLRDHGLEWIHPPAPLAHPLDDGTAVMLERDLGAAEAALGEDGTQWRRLMGPFAEHWAELAPEVLRPVHLFTRHPLLLAHLGLVGFPSAIAIAEHRFRNARTKALFAGLAAHSILALDEPLSASFGVMLGATAHAVGWPIPRGGAQSITNALCGYLASLGGALHTSTRIESLAAIGKYDVTLCDVTPRQLLRMAGERLSPAFGVNWRSTVTALVSSKLTTLCRVRFRGEPRNARAPQPCIWVALWRRLLRQRMPCGMDTISSARLFCWRSPVCSTLRAPRKGNIPRGLIATCPTARSSTCLTAWRHRLSASRRDSGIASWRAAYSPRHRWKAWTLIWWAETSVAGP